MMYLRALDLELRSSSSSPGSVINVCKLRSVNQGVPDPSHKTELSESTFGE